MPQSHASNANVYRGKAKTCAALADCARSSGDRARLLTMRDTCLSLAANEDWLSGLPPLPPANSSALHAAR